MPRNESTSLTVGYRDMVAPLVKVQVSTTPQKA